MRTLAALTVASLIFSSASVALAGPEDLPETPSRLAVVEAFRAIDAQAHACGDGAGQHGTAAVSVSFAADGHVASASVPAELASSPVGTCLLGTLRHMTVPPFRAASFRVNYPLHY
ncbi:MAG: hypothetical protein K1X94_27645 [Sandaracinaceae bacterium]|nr:hypothetical protein [Sandaracinaceae bacterium]